MAKGDWQLFVPGWQIIYMIREWRRMNRAEEERKLRSAKLEIETSQVMKQLKKLTACRCGAVAGGQMLQAKVYDDEIDRLVTGHIHRLLREAKA